ncbi:MAG: PAS domain S-box protein [Deltaproteobacteria bacterium]|nr:PAS domain S-box protein [Deltaproteobacteria bacterium]
MKSATARTWLIPFCITAFYTALFYMLYLYYGRGIGALAILPVIALGWTFGLRAGILTAVLSLPYNFMLLHLLGVEALTVLLRAAGGPAGTLALIVIGAVIGRVSDLGRTIKQELSERSAAEEELRRTRDFLENIIESSLDSIVVTDEKGYITRANRAFLAMLGYAEEEVLGKGMYYFYLRGAGTYESTTGRWVTIGDDFFVKAAQIVDELFEKGSVTNFQSYYLNKQSKIIPTEQNIFFLYDKDNRHQGSVGIIRDITARKKIEETLQETSRTLLSLVKASPLAIVVLDMKNHVAMWNPAAEKVFGWQGDEVLGHPVPFAAEPQGEERFRNLIDTVRNGLAVMGEELRCTAKKGLVLDISLSAAPLRDDSGSVTSIMAIMSDITETKRLQKEILTVSGREQRRIGQDLHDGLGQVLTGVSFLSRALERKLAVRELPESVQAAEITKLVNDAIAQARGHARGLYPATLEADGLLAALTELAASTENMFTISCTFIYNEDITLGDRAVAVHLYRIVQEAINNAVRHGKAGQINVSLETVGAKCILTVKDDGIGMDEVPQAGKGMGISLMNYRATMIGATLVVRGVPEEGTIVTCTFNQTSLRKGDS